jgi:hypothetical protein
MLFKKKKFDRKVSLTKDVVDSISTYCKIKHPNECILILKGKSKNGVILIDGLVIPPFSHTGPTFAGFPHSFCHLICAIWVMFIIIQVVKQSHL